MFIVEDEGLCNWKKCGIPDVNKVRWLKLETGWELEAKLMDAVKEDKEERTEIGGWLFVGAHTYVVMLIKWKAHVDPITSYDFF